jgi:hypothetical protein
MNKWGIGHITIFLSLTLIPFFILCNDNFQESTKFILVVPFLFGLYHFIKTLILLIIGRFRPAFHTFLISLLFIIIIVKLHYDYYNLMMNVILLITVILIAIAYPQKSKVEPKAKTVMLFLFTLNLILLFTPDRIFGKFFNGNLVVWGGKISWDDFKAPPDTSSEYVATIESDFRYKINKVYNYPPVIAVSVMYPDSSRKQKDNPGNKVLKHEQGHFDITEIHRRMMVDSVNSRWGATPKTLKSIIWHFYDKIDQAQHDYDSITDHGVNTVAQLEYERMIDIKLGR